MKHLVSSVFALLFLAVFLTLPAGMVAAHEAALEHGAAVAEPEQAGSEVHGVARGTGHRHHHGAPSPSDHCTLGAFCVPFVALAVAEAPVGVTGGKGCDRGLPPPSLHGLVPEREPPVPRA